MAEVIPASGDDWREIERRASLPEGHVERVLLEVLQRLVPVEDRVLPIPGRHVEPAGGVTEGVQTSPTTLEINKEWLATYREDEARYDIVAFARAILAKWGNRAYAEVARQQGE